MTIYISGANPRNVTQRYNCTSTCPQICGIPSKLLRQIQLQGRIQKNFLEGTSQG